MTSMILFLIKTATVFSVLYFVYMLFLNKLTFHRINRIILLLLLPVSLLTPFADQFWPSISSKIIEVPLFQHLTFETMNQQLQVADQPLTASYFNFTTIMITVYWSVLSIYLLRILIDIRQLFVLKSSSKIEYKSGYQVLVANVPDIFSYFNWIFIPKHAFDTYDSKILEHEKVHIRLKHSWDVILTELYLAFFWFNPFIYFYRNSLKSIHEFQADNSVIQNGTKTSQYMELLLQTIDVQKPNKLYSYFNQTILKKRINMMTKPKSKRFAKMTYLLFIPVCLFLVLAFSSVNINNNPYLDVLDTADILSAPPSLFPVQNGTVDNISAFFGSVGKHSKNKGIIHGGIDIKGESGTPILATADGIVSKASLQGDWGNLIVITHADGFETWYAHLKEFNTSEIQSVKRGDIIGYLGNTGKSTGPHLHYEVRQNGKRLDPINYIK